MAKLSTEPYKGVQDFYPEDMAIQNYIFSVWRKVAKQFGYEEYSASPLEPTELYTEKSGDEIVNQQTFTFTDRGGRSVTLRPEMTPTLARMVAARRKSLKYPLRWYSIPNLFRYEKPQRGRRREHWQLNVDIVGVAGIEAEIEIITLADSIMQAFGAKREDYEIRLNFPNGNRVALEEFEKQLADKGIRNTKIDETLARGQAYYTGIVFEMFDTNPANSRSLCGGGRYDDLTKLFEGTQNEDPLAFAGFGWGDITMRDFLEIHGLLPSNA